MYSYLKNEFSDDSKIIVKVKPKKKDTFLFKFYQLKDNEITPITHLIAENLDIDITKHKYIKVSGRADVHDMAKSVLISFASTLGYKDGDTRWTKNSIFIRN